MKIINCFYNNSENGFGDFLRGSVYLYNHTSSRGVDFDINIQHHDLRKYISFDTDNECDLDDIVDFTRYSKDRSDNHIGGLKKITDTTLDSVEGTKFVSSNYHNCLLDIKNVIKYLNSMPPLTKRCMDFFKKRIKFHKSIEDSVKKTLERHELKEFDIIHFRIGDKKSFKIKADHAVGDNIEFKELYKKCIDHLLQSTLLADDPKPLSKAKPLIVLSDCNELKEYIKQKAQKSHLPIHVFHLNSVHTQKNPQGFDFSQARKDENLFYVAFDAKLLTLADSVQSYSVYNHGSGFVYWMCKIYGVPVSLNLL